MTQETEISIKRERLYKWTKALACFLALMWFCTIVSRSIYVSKLTRVKSEVASEKYIEHRIEVDGIVEAGGEQAVMTLSGLRVEKIYVREGDWVEQGDLLFQIDLSDLAAIIAEKETELTKQQYHLADAQFNEILSEQKKEIQQLWAEEDYENAKKETQVSITRAKEDYQKAQSELQTHLQSTVPVTSDEDKKKAWAEYHSYRDNYYAMQDKVSEWKTKIAEMEQQIKETKDAGNDTASLEEELDNAKASLADEQKALTNYERNPVSKPDYSAEESAYDNWQNKKVSLEDSVREAQHKLEDAQLLAADTLQSKLRDTATAETLSPSDSTAEIYELEILYMQSKLQTYYAIRDAKGRVTAPNTGYVLSVQVRSGGRTTDNASVILSDESNPCYFQFTVDKEQSKYIQMGNSVEIKINDKNVTNGRIEAKVDYLIKNQQNAYDLRCELPEGIGYPGLGGIAVRSVQGEKYNICIPTEALYQENEAYYVYILQERESILGKEYYAEKIKVRVLDKNDRFVALEEGSIDKETQVITFSSKELKQGESVRLL